MIDKIAFIYIVDGKILSSRSKGKDVWYIPGGKREGNESDIETLVRECKEELTIDIKPESARFYGVFEAQAHGKAEGVIVRMTCYTANFTGTIAASSEIDEVSWLTTADMSIISPVDKLIFTDLNSKRLIS